MLDNATASALAACDTEQPSYLASILPISVVAPLIAAVVGGAALWIKKKFSVSDKALLRVGAVVEAVIDSVDGLKTEMQPKGELPPSSPPPTILTFESSIQPEVALEENPLDNTRHNTRRNAISYV